MARLSEKDRVAADQKRVSTCSKDVFEPWEDKWSCDMLEEYHYGIQWAGDEGDWNKRRYVINLFYPAINISKPSMLFQAPKFRVTPRPTRMDDPLSDVEARAKLQEETLNSFVQDPDLGFDVETQLALFDSQFRFGVVQVGYTADFVDNPQAGRPMLSDDIGDDGKPKPMLDRGGNTIAQPKALPASEGLFIKWISAKQFRVSGSSNRLEKNDWCGYFEWHYADDLRANTRYNAAARNELKATGRIKSASGADSDSDKKPGMVKVWFKWDLRSRERRIFAEGAEKYLLVEPFKFLPLAALKFDEILGQWLPLPPTYNWVHPQNELNDTREMQKVHRRRAVRRYLRKAGAFNSEEEWNKLCEGDDMVSAEVNGDTETAVRPIQDAPLDPAVGRNLAITHDDFTRISGISGESQQVAQSETATQANLIALMGQTRENAKRMVVGKWLSAVGRLILLTLRENMALSFWVKRAVDPESPLAAAEAQEVAKLWKQIDSEELGDIDNDISVDLSSMSPVQQASERTDWMTFLQIMKDPAIGMLLSQSPSLMRKTAGMFNIHSERDLKEVAAAMQAAALMFAQAQAQKAGGGPSTSPAPGPTPTNNDIAGQLSQQLPVEAAQ